MRRGNPCDQRKDHEPARNRLLRAFSTRLELGRETPFVCGSQRYMELLPFPSKIFWVKPRSTSAIGAFLGPMKRREFISLESCRQRGGDGPLRVCNRASGSGVGSCGLTLL